MTPRLPMSSVYWRILPHATACIAGERLFLLDIRQDRYLCVPPAQAAGLRQWLGGRSAGALPREIPELLARAGILRPGDPPPTSALSEHVPLPEPASVAAGSVPVAAPLGVAASVALTLAKLRLLPLRSILAQRAARAPLAVPCDMAGLLGAAHAFERARNTVPIARNCLLDSLALDGWLARRGIAVMLVFGIVAEPFEAHCWLQTREAILNDSFDQVSRFTPILAA